jgi:superfamily II DNA or RNA helicase
LIFATYEFANEGLDIPDLNTLIFALPPKGNLDQCIGRILRKKNNNPLLIDFIDNFDIFKFLGINRIKNYK